MKSGISRYTLGGFNQTALDDVYNKAKEIYKDAVTPPSSGITPATTDLIWADMNEPNTGWVSAMPSSFGQFQGPVRKDPTVRGQYTDMNIWCEIEAGGDGSGCSLDMNQATNTRVEFGWTRGYALDYNGNWTKVVESINHEQPTGNGSQYPFPGKDEEGIFPSTRGCTGEIDDTIQDVLANSYPTDGFHRIEASGFKSIKPQSYFRWHGWGKRTTTIDYTKIRCIFGEVYMRLIVEDETKQDDRHLAYYVAHLSSDIYDREGNDQVDAYKGDLGMTRYKRITNDWQSFGFLSVQAGYTKAEFEANPPPFAVTP